MLLTSTVCLFCVTKTIVSICTMNSVHYGIMCIYFCEARIKRSQRKRKRTTKMWLRTAYLKSHPTVFNRLLRCYISCMYMHTNDDILLFTLGNQQRIFFFRCLGVPTTCGDGKYGKYGKYHKKSPWSLPPLNWGVYRSSWRNLPLGFPLASPTSRLLIFSTVTLVP